MNSLVYIVFYIASSFGAKAAEKGYEFCSLTEEEAKRCDVRVVDGKKEGKEVCRALDNPEIILREAQFSSGKLNGPLTCRDFLNQIYLQGNYRDGKLDGEQKDYSNSRYWKNIKQAWNVKYFENGKQVGMEFYTDLQGKILDILPDCWERGEIGSNFAYCLSLKYGQYDGAIKKYLQAEISKRFKEMNRDIENKFENGKIKFKAKLVNGRFEGLAVWYHQNGEVKSKVLFDKGIQVKVEDFFETGKPESIKLFKDGKAEKKEVFYENGKLAEIVKITHEKGRRREHTERFTDQGFRQSEYTSKFEFSDHSGRLDGIYRNYGKNGQLVYEAYFISGQRDGKVTIQYPDRKEVEVWVKGKHKETVISDEKTGKPIEKIEYMNDGSEKSRIKLNPISI